MRASLPHSAALIPNCTSSELGAAPQSVARRCSTCSKESTARRVTGNAMVVVARDGSTWKGKSRQDAGRVDAMGRIAGLEHISIGWCMKLLDD